MHEDRRARMRCDGFVTHARKAGARVEIVEHVAPASAEVGSTLVQETLRLYPETDGISCSNDHIALGALFACERLHIPVPDRLAVISFGDLSFRVCQGKVESCFPEKTRIESLSAVKLWWQTTGYGAPHRVFRWRAH
ncbi:substrate-binding domain-containing protein [Rhizobium sp.]|jgi:DNA-binding LacI/PurR family transcriptional regulator|uniref:substrate-binding domain-containing protein n=1 Tax=Rhizobium sp. TaxID=391 RepID=UPI000E9164B2|nr:hypothetical protein [Rhizobium sp.]